jgi:hypothetical protein
MEMAAFIGPLLRHLQWPRGYAELLIISDYAAVILLVGSIVFFTVWLGLKKSRPYARAQAQPTQKRR